MVKAYLKYGNSMVKAYLKNGNSLANEGEIRVNSHIGMFLVPLAFVLILCDFQC